MKYLLENEKEMIINSDSFLEMTEVEYLRKITEEIINYDSGIIFGNGNTMLDKEFVRFESSEETIKTYQKVVMIKELDLNEQAQVEKINYIIKRLLKILYNGKFSNFLFSFGFAYMVGIGISEEWYILSFIYMWVFLKFVNVKDSYIFLKKYLCLLKNYKDDKKDLKELINKIVMCDEAEVKMYLSLKKS